MTHRSMVDQSAGMKKCLQAFNRLVDNLDQPELDAQAPELSEAERTEFVEMITAAVLDSVKCGNIYDPGNMDRVAFIQTHFLKVLFESKHWCSHSVLYRFTSGVATKEMVIELASHVEELLTTESVAVQAKASSMIAHLLLNWANNNISKLSIGLTESCEQVAWREQLQAASAAFENLLERLKLGDQSTGPISVDTEARQAIANAMETALDSCKSSEHSVMELRACKYCVRATIITYLREQADWAAKPLWSLLHGTRLMSQLECISRLIRQIAMESSVYQLVLHRNRLGDALLNWVRASMIVKEDEATEKVEEEVKEPGLSLLPREYLSPKQASVFELFECLAPVDEDFFEDTVAATTCIRQAARTLKDMDKDFAASIQLAGFYAKYALVDLSMLPCEEWRQFLAQCAVRYMSYGNYTDEHSILRVCNLLLMQPHEIWQGYFFGDLRPLYTTICEQLARHGFESIDVEHLQDVELTRVLLDTMRNIGEELVCYVGQAGPAILESVDRYDLTAWFKGHTAFVDTDVTDDWLGPNRAGVAGCVKAASKWLEVYRTEATFLAYRRSLPVQFLLHCLYVANCNVFFDNEEELLSQAVSIASTPPYQLPQKCKTASQSIALAELIASISDFTPDNKRYKPIILSHSAAVTGMYTIGVNLMQLAETRI